MKKFFISLLSLCFIFCLSFTGCSTDTVDDSEGTLNIFMFEGGYGTEFMDEWIKAFRAIEGNEDIPIHYEADVEASTKATNYLANPSENPYDLFLTGSIGFKTQAELGNLVDISDVYENLENPLIEEFRDIGYHNGGYYMIPWANGPCGLVYNTTMLPEDKVPNTSLELLNLCKDIVAGNIETAKGVKPFVWAGNNAGDYWQYITDCWWAQYEGIDAYYDFWSLNDNDPNGYTVYGQEGILESFKALESILKPEYCVHGSDTKAHTTAQGNFMLGQAVMIPVGDWLENETKGSYSDIQNYKLMKTPVISALGKELKLAGVGKTEEEYDAVLSDIIELVDAGTPVDTIASQLGVDVSKVQIVADARNIVVNIGTNHQAYIPSKSNAIDEAKAFLKFMSSDTAARIFREYAKSALPFEYDVEFEAGSPYMQSKDKLLEKCVSMIPYTDASSIRYKAGLMKWNKDSDVEKQIYNGTITAAEFYEGNYNFFTSAGENRWDYYYSRR